MVKDLKYQHGHKRALAHLFDLIFVALPIMVLVNLFLGNGNSVENTATIIGGILFVVYLSLTEGYYGQSLGKKLFKIKVLKEDGKKCDLKSAVIRNILRIVDVLPNLYIVGILVITFTPKKQRIGDLAAKTVVVKK